MGLKVENRSRGQVSVFSNLVYQARLLKCLLNQRLCRAILQAFLKRSLVNYEPGILFYQLPLIFALLHGA